MDEQWGYVRNKQNQRGLFHDWEPRFKRVIANAFGRSISSTLKKLLNLLKSSVIFVLITGSLINATCLSELRETTLH
ncbi:MAG: IS1 family transposase [Endozoicomonas sp. (ex Botrylloides leachii)]|nr:IS1 family transposase [Endozoicomonas sp. (ex Botrylloides leachii)]